MIEAENLAIIFAGIFFLNGLLTGVWKFNQISKSADGKAHPYVDIAHRSSCLLYTSPSPRDAHESRMPSSA